MLEGSKNISNNIANTGVEMYNNTASAASNALSSGMESVTNSVEVVKDFGAQYINNFSTVFFALIGLVIVSVVIGYGLYVLIIEKAVYQQRFVVPGTEVPVLCNKNKEFKIKAKPDDTNGKRRTFAFWIYINDISKYSGNMYRHVAHIGDSNKKIKDASPYIFLDHTSNKLYVRIAPTEDQFVETTKLNSVTDTRILLKQNTIPCGFEINYIPVQRWVHVAFSINDNMYGYIYVYIDAELVEVKKNTPDYPLDVSKLNLDKDGDLFTGGNTSESEPGLTGFSGLISKFTIFNYDLNQNDVYKEYNQGPFSGLLAGIGLDSYGIRNPIYKLSDEQ